MLALIAAGLIMVLYWAAPNVRQPGVRWLTPGGLLAVLLWVLVSGGFALYVANFGSYNKTYGTLAAVVVFLDLAVAVEHGAAVRRRAGRRADQGAQRGRRRAGRAGAVRGAADPPKPDKLPG